MPAFATIPPEKLARLIGTPKAPLIVDVRDDDDRAIDPYLVPTAKIMASADVAQWGRTYSGQTVAVVCKRGKKLSEGVAAWLRHLGADAESVEGDAVQGGDHADAGGLRRRRHRH